MEKSPKYNLSIAELTNNSRKKAREKFEQRQTDAAVPQTTFNREYRSFLSKDKDYAMQTKQWKRSRTGLVSAALAYIPQEFVGADGRFNTDKIRTLEYFQDPKRAKMLDVLRVYQLGEKSKIRQKAIESQNAKTTKAIEENTSGDGTVVVFQPQKIDATEDSLPQTTAGAEDATLKTVATREPRDQKNRPVTKTRWLFSAVAGLAGLGGLVAYNHDRLQPIVENFRQGVEDLMAEIPTQSEAATIVAKSNLTAEKKHSTLQHGEKTHVAYKKTTDRGEETTGLRIKPVATGEGLTFEVKTKRYKPYTNTGYSGLEFGKDGPIVMTKKGELTLIPGDNSSLTVLTKEGKFETVPSDKIAQIVLDSGKRKVGVAAVIAFPEHPELEVKPADEKIIELVQIAATPKPKVASEVVISKEVEGPKSNWDRMLSNANSSLRRFRNWAKL